MKSLGLIGNWIEVNIYKFTVYKPHFNFISLWSAGTITKRFL